MILTEAADMWPFFVAVFCSDVNMLMEAEAGFTMFNLLKLEEDISKRINRKVDLVEHGGKVVYKKGGVLIGYTYFMSRSDEVYILDILELITAIENY